MSTQDIALTEDNFISRSGLSVYHGVSTPTEIFEIHGDTTQILHMQLAPGQEIQCEPGTMIYTSNDVKAKVKLGGFARIMVDGSLFKSIYSNKGSHPGYIGISANFPATVIPINLDTFGGGGIACKHESFLAAVDPKCQIKITSLNSASALGCCCAGMPFLMESIVAKGWVFIAAHGTIMEKELAQGEELVVDTDSVVAVSQSVTVDVLRTGSCLTMCCSGEGLFNTALKGPGKVILSSMPIEKIRKLFRQAPPKEKKDSQSAPNQGV